MASLVPPYRRAFAADLALFDVFSVYHDGRDEARVISTPEIHRNMIGSSTFITFRANPARPSTLPSAPGLIILNHTSLVYIKNTSRKENP